MSKKTTSYDDIIHSKRIIPVDAGFAHSERDLLRDRKNANV